MSGPRSYIRTRAPKETGLPSFEGPQGRETTSGAGAFSYGGRAVSELLSRIASSDAPSFMTGSALVIDGGALAGSM